MEQWIINTGYKVAYSSTCRALSSQGDTSQSVKYLVNYHHQLHQADLKRTFGIGWTKRDISICCFIFDNSHIKP